MLLEGWRQPRTRLRFLVQLFAVHDLRVSELPSVENVSAHGARLATWRSWEPGLHVDLRSPGGNLWARARVVYCQSTGSNAFAVGLNLLTQTSDWEARRSSISLDPAHSSVYRML